MIRKEFAKHHEVIKEMYVSIAIFWIHEKSEKANTFTKSEWLNKFPASAVPKVDQNS